MKRNDKAPKCLGVAFGSLEVSEVEEAVVAERRGHAHRLDPASMTTLDPQSTREARAGGDVLERPDAARAKAGRHSREQLAM
jgi:hypothetical protein